MRPTNNLSSILYSVHPFPHVLTILRILLHLFFPASKPLPLMRMKRRRATKKTGFRSTSSRGFIPHVDLEIHTHKPIAVSQFIFAFFENLNRHSNLLQAAYRASNHCEHWHPFSIDAGQSHVHNVLRSGILGPSYAYKNIFMGPNNFLVKDNDLNNWNDAILISSTQLSYEKNHMI